MGKISPSLGQSSPVDTIVKMISMSLISLMMMILRWPLHLRPSLMVEVCCLALFLKIKCEDEEF